MSGACGGFYVMSRDWMNHPRLKTDDPFTKREAWVWLIETVVYKDTRFLIHGDWVTIKRGQTCQRYRDLAKTWGWPLATVQRFLSGLKSDGMIDTSTGTGRMVLSVCNYDKYQFRARTGDTASDTGMVHPAVQERDVKEGREVNQGSKPDTLSLRSRADKPPSRKPKPAKGQSADGRLDGVMDIEELLAAQPQRPAEAKGETSPAPQPAESHDAGPDVDDGTKPLTRPTKGGKKAPKPKTEVQVMKDEMAQLIHGTDPSGSPNARFSLINSLIGLRGGSLEAARETLIEVQTWADRKLPVKFLWKIKDDLVRNGHLLPSAVAGRLAGNPPYPVRESHMTRTINGFRQGPPRFDDEPPEEYVPTEMPPATTINSTAEEIWNPDA